MSLADDARWCADNLDHSLTLTKADNAMALLRSCADKLDRLTAELASEKRVSDAGKAFRDLVVKERDYARIKNDRLTAELAAAKRDAERLRNFSLAIIRESWKSEGVDGEFVQTEAVKFGLLKEETMQKACGENCGCAEYGEFPLNCYRLTPLAKGGAAIAEQEPNK